MALDFPNSPTNGQVFGAYTWNSARGVWLQTSMSSRVVTTSDTPPASPTNGDMWMYTVDGTCFIYYNDGTSGQWVEQSKSILTPATYQSPNYIINGALDYWQRSTSATQASNTTGYPSADRYKVWSAGAAAPALTLARSTDTPTVVPVQYSGAWSWSASTSTGDVILSQVIENGKYLFAGQTVTVSFYAKAASAITVGSFFDQDYGSYPQNITASWARYSYTISLPITFQSSRPAGTLGTNDVELRFLRLTSTSSAANTIYFTGLQVEIGSVATPFRRSAPNLQAELAACQRYYQFHDFIVGSGDSAGYKFATNPLGQLLRATPTITATTTGGPSQSPVYSTATAQSVLGKGGFSNGAGATAGAYVIFTNVSVNAEL